MLSYNPKASSVSCAAAGLPATSRAQIRAASGLRTGTGRPAFEKPAERLQPPNEIFVASIDVVHVPDHGLAFGS